MESFIGVIIGGLISLAGVLLTLRWNQKLHEENLREERRKTKEEREFSSKQAAFMLASEALVRCLHYYISLPNRSLPVETVPAEITELSIAINRLHFYCELETIEKLTILEQMLNKAYGEAILAKMTSGFIDGDLKAIDLRISAIKKMNTKIQDEIIAMLKSGPENPLLASRYEQQAKNCHEMADMEGKRVKLIQRKYEETEKCRDVVIANMRTVNKSFRDMLLLVRRELSFTIDQEGYKIIIDKYMESMERTSEQLFAEIRNQFAERMQSEGESS
jgi:hypothetical protein